MRAALTSGAGLEKFRDIIAAQGGDPRVDRRLRRGCRSRRRVRPGRRRRDGVVTGFDAELVGRAAVALGAGRDRVDAAVDPAAGIDIVAPVGATRAARRSGADGWRVRMPRGWPAARALLDQAVTIGDDGRRPVGVAWCSETK